MISSHKIITFKPLLMLLVFFVPCVIYADNNPTPPGTGNINSPTLQTSPNVTLAPSADDKDEVNKMFKDATYDNFEKQKPLKMFDIKN